MIEQLALAGLQGGTNLINYKLQQDANRQNRQFAREMYNREFTDRREMWEEANRYNHPLQQMQRLREAGLNPHLVYGKGATNTAPMIQGASGKSATSIAPRIPDQNLISRMQQVRMARQTTDNLAKQNEVLEQEKLLKAAQTFKTLTEGKRGEFDLGLKQETRDALIREIQLTNNLRQQEIFLNFNQDAREALKLNLARLSFGLEEKKFEDQKKTTAAQREKIRQDIKESAKRIAVLVEEQQLKQIQTDTEAYKKTSAKLKAERDEIARDIEKEVKRLMDEEGIDPDSPKLLRALLMRWDHITENEELFKDQKTGRKRFEIEMNIPRTGYFEGMP